MTGIGSRVVLHPRGGADALTRALDGRVAIVDAVEADLDDNVLLAVVLEDDPARDIGKARRLAHRFFFRPDEVELLPDGAAKAPRILVAGIGNVFFGDDGFGVEVVRRLARRTLPPRTDVVDFGIRGMDLAYALGDGYAGAILVDAAPLGAAPGTIEVIEPAIEDPVAPPQGHGMDPARVLALAHRIGSLPGRTLIVACEPAVFAGPEDEAGMSDALSPAVLAAVPCAEDLVLSLVRTMQSELEEGQLV